MSYSGAAASMPAMITTNATASQSISDGKVKKSSMAYSCIDEFQVIAGKDAKTAEPGKACYVLSFSLEGVRHQAAFQHSPFISGFGGLSHRLPIVQAH